MDDWDKLDQQFAGNAQPAAAVKDPWDQLDAAQSRPAPAAAAPAAKTRPSTPPSANFQRWEEIKRGSTVWAKACAIRLTAVRNY